MQEEAENPERPVFLIPSETVHGELWRGYRTESGQYRINVRESEAVTGELDRHQAGVDTRGLVPELLKYRCDLADLPEIVKAEKEPKKLCLWLPANKPTSELRHPGWHRCTSAESAQLHC